jgi:hypothetical protein
MATEIGPVLPRDSKNQKPFNLASVQVLPGLTCCFVKPILISQLSAKVDDLMMSRGVTDGTTKQKKN